MDNNQSFRSLFQKRFRALRESMNMSQEAFAKFLGLSRPTIGFYERADLDNGRIPDAETLRTICEKCHVSADYLLGISDEKTVDDIRAYTGLSDIAIEYLHKLHMIQSIPPKSNRLAILAYLLSFRKFDNCLAYMERYVSLRTKKSTPNFVHSPEYTMCKDLLQKHGYTIASSYHEAQVLFDKQISPSIRVMLDEIADIQNGAIVSDNIFHSILRMNDSGDNNGEHQKD